MREDDGEWIVTIKVRECTFFEQETQENCLFSNCSEMVLCMSCEFKNVFIRKRMLFTL